MLKKVYKAGFFGQINVFHNHNSLPFFLCCIGIWVIIALMKVCEFFWQVVLLQDKLLLREKEMGISELSDTNKLSQEPLQKPVAESVSEGEVSKVSIVACKQEDMSSAKSDIFDSDSPHYTDGVHSSLLEPGDSSNVFEPDQSDLSQDEVDNLNLGKSLLPAYIFPKLEDVDYSDPSENSCNFGFPADDHAFWSWSY